MRKYIVISLRGSP